MNKKQNWAGLNWVFFSKSSLPEALWIWFQPSGNHGDKNIFDKLDLSIDGNNLKSCVTICSSETNLKLWIEWGQGVLYRQRNMLKFQWRTVTQSHTNSISAPRGLRVLSVIPKYNLQLLHWQRTWACVNFNFVWTVWEVSAGAEHCAVHFPWLRVFSVISFNLCLCLGLSWFSVFRKQ